MDIATLIPQFGGVIWTLLAFILALSVIVAIHEYGHYIVGRWSGIKADVFSLGFGPVLYSRVDKHGTRWQVAALPFGGYVKFAGDSDAASGKDAQAMQEAAEDPARLRATMHGAPLWARTATVAAGPLFNFALSILIFAGVSMNVGVAKEPLTVGTMIALPQGDVELRAGDEIRAINGDALPKDAAAYEAFLAALPLEPVLDYTVLRAGDERTVTGPYLMPTLVQGVSPQSAAYQAGLEQGDVITAVDGMPIVGFSQLKVAVEGSEGRPLLLDIWRAGEMKKVTLEPKRTDEPQADGGFETFYRIGIRGGMAFEPATQALGPGAALWGGVQNTWRIMEGSVTGLGSMIVGKISTCNLSGPVGIAQTSGAVARQGFQSFIYFIAVLSTAVGLLNLFPIPALDGGHLVFYAYEAVTGKPPSDAALRFLMGLGLSLVLGLMVFALFKDLTCP